MGAARRVLVVGGGAAGLGLAAAQARRGVEVEVVEAAPRAGGASLALTLPAPARRALERLGVADAVVGAGVSGPDRLSVVGVTQPALARVLVAAVTGAGGTVTTGTSVISLTERGLHVEAALTDGTTRTVDLVVGCDGTRSIVRRLAFVNAPLPRPTGQTALGFLVPRLPGEEGTLIEDGPGGRLVLQPVSPDLTYGVCLLRRMVDPLPSPAAWPALVRAEVPAVSERVTDTIPVDVRVLATEFVTPPWHRGRIVLAGDAAHTAPPHLAAGAVLALEDAAVLDEELAGAHDVATALARYERRRVARCRAVVDATVTLGEIDLDPRSGTDPAALAEATEKLLAEPF
jgi:2-polyprenyl-6-methoxyphenol hydroxylase-like FAD-dependent oxidoreductase